MFVKPLDWFRYAVNFLMQNNSSLISFWLQLNREQKMGKKKTKFRLTALNCYLRKPRPAAVKWTPS